MKNMNTCFDLKIGFNCNNNCKHCVVANKRDSGNLSLPRILAIIESLDPSISAIQITGGEPSINPNIDVILAKCRQKGLFVIVQTNGTGFSDRNLCNKCFPNIDHIHMAIHSSNPEIHDTIVQSKGMWEKTIEGFKNAIDWKKDNPNFKLTTQTVLSKFNIESIPETFKMIQEMCPNIEMSFTYPHIMGNALNFKDEVIFRYSDYKDVIDNVLESFHNHIFTESIPYCYLHPHQDVIRNSLEHDLAFRDYNRIGIDFYEGFDLKDYNDLDIKDRRKASRCKECIYFKKCPGVWKEYVECFKDKLDLYPIKEKK